MNRCPYYPPRLPSECVQLVPRSPATAQPSAVELGSDSRSVDTKHQQQQRHPTAPLPHFPQQVEPHIPPYCVEYQEYPRPPPGAYHSPFRHQEEYLAPPQRNSPRAHGCRQYEYPQPRHGPPGEGTPPGQAASIGAGAAIATQQSAMVHTSAQYPWHTDVRSHNLGFQYPTSPTIHPYPSLAPPYAHALSLRQLRYPPPGPSFCSPMHEDIGASIQIVLQKQTGDITSIFEGDNHRLMIYEGFAYDVVLRWKHWSLVQTTGRGIYGRIYYAAVGENAPMYDLYSAKWFHWQDGTASNQHYPTWCRCYYYVLDLSKVSVTAGGRGEPRPDVLRPEAGEPPVASPAFYRIEFGTADSREDAFARVSKSKIPVAYCEFMVHSKRTAYHHRKKRKCSIDVQVPTTPALSDHRETPKEQL